jgi:predicted anti-sigma-YlaC factor YlaD
MKMRCKKSRKNISLAMDSRLQPAAMEKLQGHLDVCPACRDWQKDQVWLFDLMKTAQASQQLSPDFYVVLHDRINKPHMRIEFFKFSPSSFRPAMLGAAVVLILIFSTFLGFFLGNRLDAPAAEPAAAVFSRTMNLNVYADMPAESFGAVYERLLQGELQ